ncbi:60S ribosomal protein L24, partial [Ilyodon furcidens]
MVDTPLQHCVAVGDSASGVVVPLHKKGDWREEVTKKRSRRAVKFQRAITGASLAEILAKRNQKPEVRKAQREQAIRAAKEAKKAKQAAKKPTAASAK